MVNGLGEHWSIGATGDVESSTFDNIELSISATPAIEFNIFPYSSYTRRQLRLMYGAGVERNIYYETTIYGKDEETLPLHEVSVAYEQREPWGSLQARTEWSQYPSRPVEDAARARRGILTARRTGPVCLDKRQCLANPRSTGSRHAGRPTRRSCCIRRLQTGYEHA